MSFTHDAGPVFLWLKKLDKIVPGTTAVSVLKKVSLHQMIMSPVHNSLFLGYTYLWTDNSGTEKSLWTRWTEKLRNDFVSTQIAACAVWFPANMLAFMLLPLRYRVPYQSALGTAWMAYLSIVGHKPLPDTSGSHQRAVEPL